MRVRLTELILFLVFCGNCILMTWSASDEGDQNRPRMKKSKSPWGEHMNLGTSGKKEEKGKGDTKGKGLAVGSSSAEAGTSNRGRSMESIQWTNEEIEDLLRYKYTHKMMGLSKGKKEGRDWKKIRAVWSAKHGDTRIKTLTDYAYFLKQRMFQAASEFDYQHPEEGVIDWTDEVNHDLIRTYYLTEEGDKSEHGKRMLAEWVKSHLPGYQNVRGEYLFNRAKAMLYGVMKVTPAYLNSEGAFVPRRGQQLILKEDHEDYLEALWKKYPLTARQRKQKIFIDAVAKYAELEAIGKERLCSHAKYLHYRKERPCETRGSKEEETVGKKKWGCMKKRPFIWKTEHDETLPVLWELEKEKNPAHKRTERFYQTALGHFSDLNDLTPLQVYRHVKHLNYRKFKHKQVKGAGQGMMQETHIPYYHFIDEHSISSMSQETQHHERMAGSSSNLGSSHQKPNLNLGLDTLHSERRSPNTDSDQD